MRSAMLTVVGCLMAMPLSANPLPQSFVSINLCLDQTLIDLADPKKILGLSPFARDPSRSWLAEAAKKLPVLSGTAEEILMLRPDRVLADGYSRSTTIDMIRANGIAIEIFPSAATIDGAKNQIRRLGDLLGESEKAQARIDAINAALEGLRAVATTGLRVLPLSRRGWAAGGDTLLGSILKEGGLLNVASGKGGGAGGFLDLETIITLRPDILVVSSTGDIAEDQGRALLLHPALMNLFPPERRLVIPEQYTVCEGPMLATAIDLLTQQLKTKRPRAAAAQ